MLPTAPVKFTIKCACFLKHFEDVGKALKSASVKYHDANNNLTTGSGNLVWQVEQLEDLGANIKKIPARRHSH